MVGWWLKGPNPTANKFCPLIRGHLVASCPKEGCTEAIAGARLHDRADSRAGARLRASELTPRFRTIQVCPKDLWPGLRQVEVRQLAN
jgi:hypothetical protein